MKSNKLKTKISYPFKISVTDDYGKSMFTKIFKIDMDTFKQSRKDGKWIYKCKLKEVKSMNEKH